MRITTFNKLHPFSETVKLIAEKLLRINKDVSCYKILGPFGLRCSYHLWFYNNENDMNDKDDISKIKYSLDFYDNDVWTRKHILEYPPDSIGIGGLNGFNNICTPIKSIKQLNFIMHQEIK